MVRVLLMIAACGLPLLVTSGCEKSDSDPANGNTDVAKKPVVTPNSSNDNSAASAQPDPASRRPNILWIVWDSVRADHMTLYGYDKPTTPHLDQWAAEARVFTDCMAAASATTAPYASMLTGLLPSEHGVNYDQKYIVGDFTSIAEVLSDSDYQSYLYTAHPGVTAEDGFGEGFDLVEHPWTEPYHDDALELVKQKVPTGDISSEIAIKIHQYGVGDWAFKAAGAFARPALVKWLEDRDRERPYFAMLVYGEAQRPHLPSMEYRERAMGKELAEKSKQVERVRIKFWPYSFGADIYSDQDIRVINGMYDATIMELDDLFADLMEHLKGVGDLDNTVVIVTADHGDLQGDYHIVGHDFVMYQRILRVPLILRLPRLIPVGAESKPVSQLDIAATVADLAGADAPEPMRRNAVSLLSPKSDRLRFAEYPSYHKKALAIMEEYFPDFDTSPYMRTLRCVTEGRFKLVAGSDGRDELFDLQSDPHESRNAIDQHPQVAQRLKSEIKSRFDKIDATASP